MLPFCFDKENNQCFSLSEEKLTVIYRVGVNISGQKSGEARKCAVKCLLKRHLVFLSPPEYATGTAVHREVTTRV